MMSFIPSENLTRILDRATGGLWIERLNDGRHALVCKIPETAIKAVFKGARCSLLFSVVEVEGLPILCLGLRVADESENPFTAIITSMVPDDRPVLMDILRTHRTTLHCINEMNHPALSAFCELQQDRALEVFDKLTAAAPFELNPSSAATMTLPDVLRISDAALAAFQCEVYRAHEDPVVPSVQLTGAIPISLELWAPTEIFEAGEISVSGPFRIDDEDEGPKVERAAETVVQAIYGGRTYRSPRVGTGPASRELIDLLAFDDHSICVVEAKAMSMLATEATRPSARRAGNVTKQIQKALNQLRGALRNIRSSDDLYGDDGRKILVPGREVLPAHAIVLLSEMYVFVDWKEIAGDIIALSEDERDKALFHVFDLLELSNIARLSKDSVKFSEFLLQRWVGVKLKGTAYGRVAKPLSDGEWSEADERTD